MQRIRDARLKCKESEVLFATAQDTLIKTASLSTSRSLPSVRKMRLLRRVSQGSVLVWSVCLVLLATGCADRNPPPLTPEESAATDSVTALLERIDETALRSAFRSVSTHAYTQRIRTGQFDEDGTLLASREQEVRHDAEGTRAIRSESSGTFDFGYLRRFVSGDDDLQEAGFAASDLSEYIIPEDPPYAVARNREAWRYEFAPDSMLSAGPVRVIRITARPGFEVSRSIRRVRLYLDRTSDRLVGIYIERVHTALWFREESAFFLSMVRLPSGTWAPDHTRFETRIKLLLRPAQRFRSSAEYYDFGEMVRASNGGDPDRTG